MTNFGFGFVAVTLQFEAGSEALPCYHTCGMNGLPCFPSNLTPFWILVKQRWLGQAAMDFRYLRYILMQVITIPDDVAAISQEVHSASESADIVITTGGQQPIFSCMKSYFVL